MKRLTAVNPGELDAAAAAACAVWRAGGVVAVPTETVYGLAARWHDPAARERIYTLKRRPQDKRLQMLALDLAMAERAGVCADPRLRAIAAAFWPGPLTLVCPAAQADAGEDATIGLRLPDHPFIRRALEQLGEPLAATSANLSGAPPGTAAAAAVAGLDGQPDLLVDGGPARLGQPSTVAALTRDGTLRILREGAVTEAQLRAVLEPYASLPPAAAS
ncbi:MAG: L-threonylcarbamoyladenylate synthase [Lentisphaeria bacterium]